MLPMDCSSPLHPAALKGLELFNNREFFEAHEALEDAWRDDRSSIRTLYQGILQVAVVYLHIQRGNHEGAVLVAARCLPKLETCGEHCRGVAVAQLISDLNKVLDALQRLGPQHIQEFDQSLFKSIQYER